jgi:hypothetical protein
VLLRASGEHDGTPHNLQSIVAPQADSNTVPQAEALLAYAEAFMTGDAAALREARQALAEAVGPGAAVDAAGIVAIFNTVVRIADATGVPLEDFKAEASIELRADLGIDAYRPGSPASEPTS